MHRVFNNNPISKKISNLTDSSPYVYIADNTNLVASQIFLGYTTDNATVSSDDMIVCEYISGNSARVLSYDNALYQYIVQVNSKIDSANTFDDSETVSSIAIEGSI